MADSIFNRPMFAAGQYADPVKPKKGGATAPVTFGFDEIYKSDFMPFDAEGVASLMQTYAQPEATRQAYEEFAGQPKSSEEFAAEYDSMYPETESVNENFGFEKNLAIARLGLGLMQPTPGGALAPAIARAGENFLADLATVNEKKRQAKAANREQEREDERAKREYVLGALQEQRDLRDSNEFDLFMKVLQFNMDSDEGNVGFRRELAKQNFAYKYDVDIMAMENNAKLLAEQFEKTPKVFAIKPEGLDQTVKYVTGYLGVDPKDGVEKPFIPKQVGDQIIYEPAPLDAVMANFSLNDDGSLKQDVKAQIAQAEKINTGNQALSFITDIKKSLAQNKLRVGAPGLGKKVLQNVRGTILDIADAFVEADIIDQDSYEAAKNKIESSVFNDLAGNYQEAYPGRNATDFYSDLESDENKIYQEFFVKPRKNYDPALAANEIKLNSIYYAIARARKPTGRLNVDDVNNAKASLSLYDFDSSSDRVITSLNAVENELRGFVNAQNQIYERAGYEKGFLYNYNPTRFSTEEELQNQDPNKSLDEATTGFVDPYADLEIE
jgi:hypothetical protein